MRTNKNQFIEVYKGDFIFVGGCEYESQTSFGTFVYKIPQFAIKKNNFFVIRHSRIPEVISSKENLTNSNQCWSDYIDASCHKLLVRASMNKAMKTTLTNSDYKVSSNSEPEKLKIIKLTLDQEKSLQNVVAKLADTSEWPLHFLDYQYKVCCSL